MPKPGFRVGSSGSKLIVRISKSESINVATTTARNVSELGLGVFLGIDRIVCEG